MVGLFGWEEEWEGEGGDFGGGPSVFFLGPPFWGVFFSP